jgi:hypothetical protein
MNSEKVIIGSFPNVKYDRKCRLHNVKGECSWLLPLTFEAFILSMLEHEKQSWRVHDDN